MKLKAAGNVQNRMQVVPKGLLLFTPVQHLFMFHTQLSHSSQLPCSASLQANVVAWAIES